MQQTEKYWSLIHRVVLIVVLLMAVVGIVLAFTPKVKQMKDYQQIKEDLQKRIDTNEAGEKEIIDNRSRYRTDPAFVEKIAHERGYAHKDEVIFLLPEESSGTNDAPR
ncbi:MAG: septum formation initiator family protein [Kiritimatiellales bacterium]|nr:septum formation initiator family protein [Kiritimatiellales bacterium]